MIETLVSACASVQNLVRRAVWPVLDQALSRLGLYASYPLKREEYAVTVPADLRSTRRIMSSMGYAPAPIAALKRSPRGEVSRGSWVHRRPRLWRSDRQTHVHLIAGDGVTHLYVHDETNWWPSPSDPRRIYRHYRPPEKGGSRPGEEPLAYDWARGQRILLTHLDHAGVEHEFDAERIA